MENFNPMHWLDDQILDAKKAAKNTPLIRNFTYFGITIDTHNNTYYDLTIPTRTKNGLHWWRICIKPIMRAKRAEDVSNIDLQVVMIDDDIHLPINNQSHWDQINNNENAVINTIPYFDNWTDIFDQLSDVLDNMIAKKEGTELEERTKSKMDVETAKKVLESAGIRFVKENIEPVTEDYDFVYMKKLFNWYDFDYARSYGPNAAYKKALDELKEDIGDEAIYFVPDSYAEWEDVLGWSIGEEPPSDDWYK